MEVERVFLWSGRVLNQKKDRLETEAAVGGPNKVAQQTGLDL